MSGSNALTILMPGLLSREFRAAAVPDSQLQGISAGPVQRPLTGDFESSLAACFGLTAPIPTVALHWQRHFPDTPLPANTLAVELVSMEAGAHGLDLSPLDADPLSDAESTALDAIVRPLLADWFGPDIGIHHGAGIWFVSPVVADGVRFADTAIAMAQGVEAAMPSGSEARLWVGRVSESQIALYGHPVNSAREARGGALASSLWFSRDVTALPSPSGEAPGQVISADPRAALLAVWAGANSGGLQTVPDTPQSGKTLIIDSGRAGAAVLDWAMASIEWLKHDQISTLTLIDPESGQQRYERATGLRRWWQAWRHHAGI